MQSHFTERAPKLKEVTGRPQNSTASLTEGRAEREASLTEAGQKEKAAWGGGAAVPDLPRRALLQEPSPLSLFLQDFLFVTVPQVDEDQCVIEETVFHLFIQLGVSGEAWRMVDLWRQNSIWG